MFIKKTIYLGIIFGNLILCHKHLVRTDEIIDEPLCNNIYLRCLKTISYPKNLPTDF